MKNLRDSADLRQEVKKFLPANLKYHVKDIKFENSEYDKLIGKMFQILIVEDRPLELPFICCADGDKIKSGDIFIRKGTESDRADSHDVDELIKRRLKVAKVPRSQDLTLKKHLSQLKDLYDELTYTTSDGGILQSLISLSQSLGKRTAHKKPEYPKEDYDAFVARMLDRKKKRIEEELDV